jgi:Nif-specific regulatory protein
VLLADRPLLTAVDLERFLPQSDSALDTGRADSPLPAVGPEAAAGPALAPLEPRSPPPAIATPLVRDYAWVNSHNVDTLQGALAQAQGNQSRAAQSLGLTLRQFSYRLRKAGLR